MGIGCFQLVRSGQQNGDILKTQSPKFPVRKVILRRHWHIIQKSIEELQQGQ
jgi:hypothetical protein